MTQLQEKSNGKCLFLSTHFYPSLEKCLSNSNFNTTLKNLTKNIFAVEKVFVPINIGNTHWTLAMIDMKQENMGYSDSLGYKNEACFQNLKEFLKREHYRIDKKYNEKS